MTLSAHTDGRALVNEIAASTHRYCLHSHTQFCDGHAPMSEMAAAARAAGFLHYAFTPHSPIPVPSGCNMAPEKVPEFLEEVERLRAEYAPEMSVYSGMEIDYLSRDWGPHIAYFRELPLDIRIGSVHFVPNQRGEFVDCDGRYERFAGYLRERFGGDIRYVVERYFEQVSEMLSLGGFDILGHLDKIAGNASQALEGIEQTGWYQDAVNTLIDSVISSGVAVEVNTKAWERSRRFFPAEIWWPRLAEAGINPVVNSDAHTPELIEAGRAEAYRRLGLVGL